MADCVLNRERKGGPQGPAPEVAAYDFHRRLPGYASTPLIDAEALAGELGVGRLLIKFESERFGLPAFKILGGSWAAYRRLALELGTEPGDWRSLDDLRACFESLGSCKLVAATDGNHGRGVARVAKLFGLEASVYVPACTVPARIAAIESEGARVHVIEGSYDETVAIAAREAGPRSFLIQDTSWEGYEDVPRWVIEGYATILFEIDDQLRELACEPPDLVLVPVGVGALLAAVLSHATHGAWPKARIVSVEPVNADCTLASLRADQSISIPGPHTSMMAGLNCGTLATIVWPLVRSGLDAALVIDEEHCAEAVRLHHRHGMDVGESGAASLAGLLALGRDPGMKAARSALGLDEKSVVLIFATEGVTDPEHWSVLVRGSSA